MLSCKELDVGFEGVGVETCRKAVGEEFRP